jgi:methylated-DNA-protein-cysteine methyltransferase-like protein
VDLVPAHRVINRLGELSGRLHFGTPTRMQELLEAEGIPIKEDKVQNFEQYFWHPLAHLNLDADLE